MITCLLLLVINSAWDIHRHLMHDRLFIIDYCQFYLWYRLGLGACSLVNHWLLSICLGYSLGLDAWSLVDHWLLAILHEIYIGTWCMIHSWSLIFVNSAYDIDWDLMPYHLLIIECCQFCIRYGFGLDAWTLVNHWLLTSLLEI